MYTTKVSPYGTKDVYSTKISPYKVIGVCGVFDYVFQDDVGYTFQDAVNFDFQDK